jgi:hypothetical protein
MNRVARIGVDVMNGGKQDEQWVRKYAGPIPKFDPQEEK